MVESIGTIEYTDDRVLTIVTSHYLGNSIDPDTIIEKLSSASYFIMN